MSVRIQAAYVDGSSGSPPVRNYTPTAAAILRGAPVTLSSGSVVEHGGGAVVTGILGINMQDVDAAGAPAIGDKTQIQIARDNVVFLAAVTDAGTVVTDLSSIEVGTDYGILKSTTWYVDIADESHVVLRIVKIFDDLNLVAFKFLASAIMETV